MSRWITITEDDLRAARHGDIMDQARVQNPGSIDPVTKAISIAVARVRRALTTGNNLDVDTTKVPGSLEGVTVRMALYALCELIGLALSDDQKDTKRNDNSDLLRISDDKIQVEPADTADATLSPQTRGNWNSENKLLGRMHPVPAPGRQFPSSGYANPDAPEDGAE